MRLHATSEKNTDQQGRRSGLLRICFLSHMFPNHRNPLFTPFMLERAKALARVAVLRTVAPVSYVPMLAKLPSHFELFKELEVFHPRYLALPSLLWHFRWQPYLNMLSRIEQKFWDEVDILHIEWIYPDAYAGAKFAAKIGLKTIGVVHGNEAIDYHGPHRHRKKYTETFKILDKIIVVSNDLKTKLVQEYQVEPEKVSVILNGVDTDKFSPGDKVNAREKLRLSQEPNIGLCVARLSEEKNIDVLIQAVARLEDKSPLIYIIGDGPLKNRLLAQIERHDVSAKIKLVGPVPHEKIPLWLAACDFFCLPSQREGCPVVIHEALACGRPVISTTVGAIPDLVCSEDYGLLCSPGDPQALAGLISEATARNWENQKISDYGRQFTWDRMAKETLKVYQSILNV